MPPDERCVVREAVAHCFLGHASAAAQVAECTAEYDLVLLCRSGVVVALREHSHLSLHLVSRIWREPRGHQRHITDGCTAARRAT